MYRRAATCLMVVSLLSGVALRAYIEWERTDKPPVSLKEASTLADAEVEKHKGKFFCIAARLGKTFTAGDWELHYSSAEGKDIWISVGSDKSLKVSTEGFVY